MNRSQYKTRALASQYMYSSSAGSAILSMLFHHADLAKMQYSISRVHSSGLLNCTRLCTMLLVSSSSLRFCGRV